MHLISLGAAISAILITSSASPAPQPLHPEYVRHLLARSEQESQAKQVDAKTQDHQFGPIVQCAPTGACQVVGGGGFLPAPQPFFPFPFYNPNVFFDPNGVRVLPGPNVVPCPNGQPGICATG